MSYTLFYSPDSASIVVRMVLEELALPYEALEVDRTQGAQRSAAFLRFNPQGLLPVLVDPAQDEPLFETAAILLHLADTHQALQPPLAARGRSLKWLFFLSNTVHADLRALFYSPRYVATEDAIAPLRTALHRRVTEHCALLEAELARHQGSCLLGAAPSICDFYLAACLRWAQLYPRGDALPSAQLAQCPRLLAMLRTLEQRPAVQKAYALEGMDGAVFTAPNYPRDAVV
ncbi:MAG: glutathione S-transferase family protein [Betaproteobacteria bacterium]|nr:glutathione S-transferase family protein [Betaproteobacteria bacterium]